jgi:hypothetical protein
MSDRILVSSLWDSKKNNASRKVKKCQSPKGATPAPDKQHKKQKSQRDETTMQWMQSNALDDSSKSSPEGATLIPDKQNKKKKKNKSQRDETTMLWMQSSALEDNRKSSPEGATLFIG